jgi:hypothetical protein
MEGYNYQMLRSTDLTNWAVVATLTMASSGTYANMDNAPLAGRSYCHTA